MSYRDGISWAIKYPSGYLNESSIRDTRTECIRHFVKFMDNGRNWRQIKAWGHSCVRVKVSEIRGENAKKEKI